MDLKNIPEKLLGPENYMEIESKDIRLSISKINNFIETLGDSSLSLIYSNKEEHNNINDRLLNIIRRIHVRHAIIDFNNCFDILLQVPWFHYRIWKEYNLDGCFFNPKFNKPEDEVIRNSSEWVHKAENSCNYKKVIKFLKHSNDKDLCEFGKELKIFNDTFVFNKNKQVTVREVANQLKHKHNIKLKEFYEPYNFILI